MKYKTNKLSNLEKNRYSILVNDMDRCCICGLPNPDINEVFGGRNRLNSIKYGLCIPLCRLHHHQYHSDRGMQLYWMDKAYNCFIQLYSIKEFKDTFRYIKGLDIF